MIMNKGRRTIPNSFEVELKVVRRAAKNTLGLKYIDWVDDLAQDAMIKAMNNLDKFDSKIASKEAWLYNLTKNLCFDFLRKKANDKDMHICIDSFFNLVCETDNQFIRNEDIKLIRTALLKLKEQDRTILNLKYMEDLSGREIAQEMNLEEKVIPTYVKRAKEKLKTIVLLMM
jgi:RNA polymerase sigma-70 factor (ECF subfamily)